MRATILLTAMLASGLAFAETPADGEPVDAPAEEATTVAPADATPAIGEPVTETPTANCDCAAETATIDLGPAPDPESPVTIVPASTAAAASGFGAGTRGWLELQVSGSAASTTARPLPGEAASHVYERYSNSFKHPIPETFERESFSTDGGSN